MWIDRSAPILKSPKRLGSGDAMELGTERLGTQKQAILAAG